jgi:hypothetical protein
MDLDGKTLADWLLAQPLENLPKRSFAYQRNYAALASNLEPLHREVTTTANRLDGGYLTDHGPDHIRKLISRISDLLSADEGCISAYEAYVLLCAAQVHDVGNIFGRDKHEEKSWQIMERNRATLPPDTIEQRLIYDIAKAHGGDRKDKLSDMPRTYDIAQTMVRRQGQARSHLKSNVPWSHEWGPVQSSSQSRSETLGGPFAVTLMTSKPFHLRCLQAFALAGMMMTQIAPSPATSLLPASSTRLYVPRSSPWTVGSLGEQDWMCAIIIW